MVKPYDLSHNDPNCKDGAALCPVFGTCGGCDLLDLPYEAQLLLKQSQMEEMFEGMLHANAIEPMVGMDDPFHYRDKIATPFVRAKHPKRPKAKAVKPKGARPGRGGECRILTGMYERGTHRVVPIGECILENEIGQRVVFAIKRIMRRHGIDPYDEDRQTGFLRHAVIRVGHVSDEVLVTLVTNSEDFPYSRSFCKELKKQVPEITTVVQNINLANTNAILGNRERILYGPGFVLDELCGLSVRISSHSFYQVNSRQTEVLYRKAIEFADIGSDETVVDAYCGTGTIGLVAAAAGAKEVIGVDNIASAITDARQNAAHNGLDNIRFICDDASKFIEHLQTPGGCPEKKHCLFMDPPRAGASGEFLHALSLLSPHKIVYISCNPKTQRRDVEKLYEMGYVIKRMVAIDMFPHTKHIENICLLVHEGKKGE